MAKSVALSTISRCRSSLARNASSDRARSARCSRTAYCRRRSRRAARTVLTTAETWTGRFIRVIKVVLKP